MRISENFTLAELSVTDQPFDNTPDGKATHNLIELVKQVLQPLRDSVGPVLITSAFRSHDVNKAVGGEDDSFHQYGLSADVVTKLSVSQTMHDIRRLKLPIDKVIAEYDRWCHIQIQSDYTENRNEFIIASKVNGKTVYTFA